MRWLLAMLGVLALAALGWSGWWYFAAGAHERAILRWLEERRADGWVAEAQAVEVRGFPFRLETTVTGLELADPEAGWSWQAPTFQFLSLAYRPHEIIAVWPGEQTVATPYDTVTVTSDRMRGSVAFEPNARLALDRATIEVENLALSGAAGWQAGLGKALLATRQAGDAGPPFAHEVAFTAENLTLPAGWAAGVDPAGVLPAAIGAAKLDATLVFDRPWDRPAVEGDSPSLERLRLGDARVTWGELELRGQGTLEADARGLASGRIDLRARNWREMIDVAESGGALPPAVAGALRTGLGLVATLAGDGDSLSVPLDFADGRVRLGPVAVGDAPRLARRPAGDG